MFTINYKAKSTNDTEIIKIEMIFYRPNYARLSRILNITGKKNEWDDKTQLFVENSSSNIEKNKKLRDEKLKFIKVAEDWEAESIEFSPKQWADYFKTPRPSSTAIKIISVSNMLDEIIERKRNRKRLINNFEVTRKGSAKYYATLKRHLGEFTTSAYNKALSTYYFTDLKSQFVEDFLFFLKKKAKENNAPSVPRA